MDRFMRFFRRFPPVITGKFSWGFRDIRYRKSNGFLHAFCCSGFIPPLTKGKLSEGFRNCWANYQRHNSRQTPAKCHRYLWSRMRQRRCSRIRPKRVRSTQTAATSCARILWCFVTAVTLQENFWSVSENLMAFARSVAPDCIRSLRKSLRGFQKLCGSRSQSIPRPERCRWKLTQRTQRTQRCSFASFALFVWGARLLVLLSQGEPTW